MVPVQVANEAAVLTAVRQYAQLQEGNGMRDSVMERVRPSSTLSEELQKKLYWPGVQCCSTEEILMLACCIARPR